MLTLGQLMTWVLLLHSVYCNEFACENEAELFQIDTICPHNDLATCKYTFPCAVGEYWMCKQMSGQLYRTGCVMCGSCPTGMYQVVQCPVYPTPSAPAPQCGSCEVPVGCQYGEYIGGCDDGKRNYVCTPCPACPAGFYRTGCQANGFSMGECVPCKVCSGDYMSASGCVGMQDRICVGGGCNATSQCSELVCSFKTERLANCQYTWDDFIFLNAADQHKFLCLQSSEFGSCQECPAGWSSEREYCVGCYEGKSCNARGQVVCNGECEPGYWPECENGHVVCHPCNSSNLSAFPHAQIARGGVVGREDLCGVYLRCDVGFFLTFVTWQLLECKACEIAEADASKWEFTTSGVTFGDNYSCIYEAKRLQTNNNSVGLYGRTEIKSCPRGFTSEAGRALVGSDCMACTNAPAIWGQYALFARDCSFTCVGEGVERVGNACVYRGREKCDGLTSGYVVINAECRTVGLPWNEAGFVKGTWNVEMSNLTLGLQSKAGNWSVDKNLVYKDSKVFCREFVSLQPTFQDVPLTTATCWPSAKQRYDYYLIHTHPNSRYLFVFLERQFGYNNRYIMWRIIRDGAYESGVTGHWKLPGRVCSCSSAGNDLLYLAFCNTSWVGFVNASEYDGEPIVVIDTNQHVIGRFVGRLIGQESGGNVDGLRDVARFGRKLWISFAAGRLFVADEVNCRLVDIKVDFPGSFLTHAATIGESSCFSPTRGLFHPRLLTSVSNTTFHLFLNDQGVKQVDTVLMEQQLLIPWSALPANVTFLEGLWNEIRVYNGSMVYTFSRRQQACAAGMVSQRGSPSCYACPSGTFTTDHVLCVACSKGPPLSCAVGFYESECTNRSDRQCLACPAAPVGKMYVQPGSCLEQAMAYVVPCPSGFWEFMGLGYCVVCPQWSIGINCSECVHGGVMNPRTKTCENVGGFVRFEANQEMPDWFPARDLKCKAEECSGLSCYLASIVPRACLVCPAGMVSENNVWCYPCGPDFEPGQFGDECVCKRFLHWNGSACVCDTGFRKTSDGCIACAANEKFDNDANQCVGCPDGFEQARNKTICAACEYGKYRVGENMPMCVACASDDAYAPNASVAQCLPCVESCEVGQRWDPCPRGAKFRCSACAPLTANERFVVGRENKKCFRECKPDFFYDTVAQACLPCRGGECEPGFLFTACGVYEDGHCLRRCANATKPLQHAKYVHGCAWACESGYVLATESYLGITDYICRLV